jgi:hypothetical protein
MTKARLTALAAAVLVLHWLATAQVTITAAGFPVAVPVLALAAIIVAAVAAAAAVLLVCRSRAEQAAVMVWRSRYAARPPEVNR